MHDSLFEGIPLMSRPARYGGLESTLRLDNPSAARLRAIINGWVAADSDVYRRKIRTDLLSRRTSTGTFHELLLRQILRRKFGNVQREPEGLPVGRRYPDFGVRVGQRGRLVVFEGTAVREQVGDQQRKRREIMQRLDGVDGPWHFVLDWHSSHGLENVPPRQVEATVRRALTDLGPGEHDLDCDLGAARLRAFVHSAATHRLSIVSADFSRPVVFSPGVKAIRKEIKKKAERYRGLKGARIPLIVAVGSDDPLVDWHTVFTALYGDETVKLRLRNDEIVAVEHGGLNFEGKVTPGRLAPPVHTTLSAAWHMSWAMLADELQAQVVQLPNPWAANPVRIDGKDFSRVTVRRRNSRVEFTPPARLRRIAFR